MRESNLCYLWPSFGLSRNCAGEEKERKREQKEAKGNFHFPNVGEQPARFLDKGLLGKGKGVHSIT